MHRSTIARDLHDELGSGLGSIAILAELVADGDLPADDRRALAERVRRTAHELSASLDEIVWSLRSAPGTLGDLVGRLRERAASVFASDDVELRLALPAELPALALDGHVQRNVRLIVHEALHNAARHARATAVELGLAVDGERVRVWVADDGVGLDAACASRERPGRGGVGLDSMARRARSIGARMRLSSIPGRGTRLELWFRPHPLH